MRFFTNFSYLAYPWVLLLWLGVFWMLWSRYRRNKAGRLERTGLRTSINLPPPGITVRLRIYVIRILPIIEAFALILLIYSMARPRSPLAEITNYRKGIDILLAMDVSQSMEKTDFKPSRLEAAKKVALEFIDARQQDRIGLVMFCGESFTKCPLTIDHEMVKLSIKTIDRSILVDGTAIGMGLATATDRLRHSAAKSKVVILLTDGANNSGKIDPKTAAELAEKYKVKVYTIGMAGLTNLDLPYPYAGDVEIDEELMRYIADKTGGLYFRATDNNSLSKIYQEINTLEKSNLNSRGKPKYEEHFAGYLFWAGILTFFTLLLRLTWLRNIID